MKNKLLLHVCCAPCSTEVIERLKQRFDVSLFFYNPNIFPKEEYDKRLEFARKIAQIHGLELIEGAYDHDFWLKKVRGLEHCNEGGERCNACFKMRLEKTAALAKEKGFICFATTLSISPHKNYKTISELGNKLAAKYRIQFLDEDFKKHDGFKKSIEHSKKHCLYRQDYCGCEFSMRAENRIKYPKSLNSRHLLSVLTMA